MPKRKTPQTEPIDILPIPAKSNAESRTLNKWDKLNLLISELVGAAIADSWSGGGDPADVQVCKARLDLAEAQLNSHIEKLRREF